MKEPKGVPRRNGMCIENSTLMCCANYPKGEPCKTCPHTKQKTNNEKVNKLTQLTDDEAEAQLEWITEAIGEGYTKKQLAKKYGCSVPTLTKFLKGK